MYAVLLAAPYADGKEQGDGGEQQVVADAVERAEDGVGVEAEGGGEQGGGAEDVEELEGDKPAVAAGAGDGAAELKRGKLGGDEGEVDGPEEGVGLREVVELGEVDRAGGREDGRPRRRRAGGRAAPWGSGR